MKVVLSPAKSLNYTKEVPTQQFTIPHFVKESQKVHRVSKKLSVKDLKELMSISDALAKLNYERNQKRTYLLDGITSDVRQAVYTFDGDVYTGLDVHTISEDKISYMQDHLWILSGLYGLLKPLDLIEAYRLEMGIRLDVSGSKDLYGFWKEKITKYINTQLTSADVLVNLASKEYFSAIDPKKVKAAIISPEFKDYKDGKLKVISFFAKKARGAMARYIIENKISDVEAIKNFNTDGYRFDENLSTATQWIFTR